MSRFYPINSPASAPQQFGRRSPVVKTLYVDLSIARDRLRMGIGGSVLWMYDSSDITANMDIYFNDQDRDEINFKRGMLIAGTRFSDVYVTNTVQAGKWAKFIYAVEGDEFLRFINPDVSFNEVKVSKATGLESVADVSLAPGATTLILAADSSRHAVAIGNLASNALTFRIGDSNTGASRSSEVTPGSSISFDTTDAIYGYNPGPGAESVTVTYTID